MIQRKGPTDQTKSQVENKMQYLILNLIREFRVATETSHKTISYLTYYGVISVMS